MLVSMSLIPIGDSAGKLLSNVYGISVWFIAWTRFLFGLIAVIIFVSLKPSANSLRYKTTFLDYRVWLRGIFIVCGISAILTSLQTEPIANVFAAFFIGPIVSYLGAAVVLKEKLTYTRSTLLGIGFFGVLLVVKPGLGESTGIYYALLAGIFYGCFLVMNRLLATTSAPSTLLVSQLAIGSLILLPLGIQNYPDIFVDEALLVCTLVLISALGSAMGNLLLLFATQLTSASALAPLIYFQLIAATVLGLTIFGEQPDGYTWIGILIVLISGVASVVLPSTLEKPKQ